MAQTTEQCISCLHAIYNELEQTHKFLNDIVCAEGLHIDQKVFLVNLYFLKLVNLEKEIKDIERQIDD